MKTAVNSMRHWQHRWCND